MGMSWVLKKDVKKGKEFQVGRWGKINKGVELVQISFERSDCVGKEVLEGQVREAFSWVLVIERGFEETGFCVGLRCWRELGREGMVVRSCWVVQKGKVEERRCFSFFFRRYNRDGGLVFLGVVVFFFSFLFGWEFCCRKQERQKRGFLNIEFWVLVGFGFVFERF